MIILIFGGKGWIGQQVIDLLTQEGNVIILSSERADNMNNVLRELNRIKPDRVFSFIGRTHGEGINTIDYLEQKGKLKDNINDNLYGIINLALACTSLNIHLTSLGTGCIFEYDKYHDTTKGFTEDDDANFFGSSYSIVKGYTEKLLKNINGPILNVRIRMPIVSEVHPRNFITKITKYDKICSLPNSMTVLDELLPVMIDMSIREVSGTINLTNPGTITHNEILEMYRDIIDPSFTWKNFSIEEQHDILKSARSNNYLDTTKLQSLYPAVKNIKESVKDILYKMKEKMR